MGSSLQFSRLRGVNTENQSINDGTKITDPQSLEDTLPGTLVSHTRTGNGYPQYEYLLGCHHQSDEAPYRGELYFADNVSHKRAIRLFEDISEYTEPFLVIISNYGAPRVHQLITGARSMPDMYILYCNNGEHQELEVDNLEEWEFGDEEAFNQKMRDEFEF